MISFGSKKSNKCAATVASTTNNNVSSVGSVGGHKDEGSKDNDIINTQRTWNPYCCILLIYDNEERLTF